jgi:uncharacterized damage-inducible protein DinB
MPKENTVSHLLADLFRHNVWANLRLFDACLDLPDADLDATALGAFGTVRDTLRHLIVNEERYLDLLEGRPLEEYAPAAAPPTLEELRARAQRCGEALVALAADLPDDRVLEGVWDGHPFSMPVAVPVIQAINHATEHRAQIAVILTQQGITPPVMDGWTFWEEGMLDRANS